MTLETDWQHTERLGQCREIPSARCILDLRARIEALEAAQREASADVQPSPETSPVVTDAELDRTFLSARTGLGGLRACYNHGVEHGAAQARCPHIRTSDEGTSYCALAEQTAAAQPAPPAMQRLVPQWAPGWGYVDLQGARLAPPYSPEGELVEPAIEPAPPPAPTGGLVERVAARVLAEVQKDVVVHSRPIASAAIREVAAWLEQRNGAALYWCDLLREEADR